MWKVCLQNSWSLTCPVHTRLPEDGRFRQNVLLQGEYSQTLKPSDAELLEKDKQEISDLAQKRQ
jgi:hypothetical protein